MVPTTKPSAACIDLRRLYTSYLGHYLSVLPLSFDQSLNHGWLILLRTLSPFLGNKFSPRCVYRILGVFSASFFFCWYLLRSLCIYSLSFIVSDHRSYLITINHRISFFVWLLKTLCVRKGIDLTTRIHSLSI